MSIDDFEVLSKVGEGLYSNVFKVKRIADNTVYAMKKVKLSDLPAREIHNAVNEVRILASIRHPNVIAYKEAFYDQASRSLCVVMEYADGGDLQEKITEHRNKGQYFREDQIWDIFAQMVQGLGKLHELGILHRDVKSANIYLTKNGMIKVGDMNVSKVSRKEGMCETQTGAPYYASPQVWRDEAYDSKSDIWSLGCVLYEVISLKLPFRARDMEGLYKKVNRGYYSRINKSYSQQLSEMLKVLLNINPKERKNCRDIIEFDIFKKNTRKYREPDVQQKSVLLKTIKVGKNINLISSSLPKPNYSPLRYRSQSLSDNKASKLKMSQSSVGEAGIQQKKLGASLKLSLPPVASNVLPKNGKMAKNLSPPSSKQSRLSASEKVRPRYRRARSHLNQ